LANAEKHRYEHPPSRLTTAAARRKASTPGQYPPAMHYQTGQGRLAVRARSRGVLMTARFGLFIMSVCASALVRPPTTPYKCRCAILRARRPRDQSAHHHSSCGYQCRLKASGPYPPHPSSARLPISQPVRARVLSRRASNCPKHGMEAPLAHHGRVFLFIIQAARKFHRQSSAYETTHWQGTRNP